MQLKQLSKWLVIGGTLLIWTIKFIIRPMQVAEGSFTFLLGIAPNLLGSFLIPFGACWFFSGRNHLVARVFRVTNPFELRLVCLAGFAMLVINEYLQKIPLFGRTFDYNDILFSSIGLLCSFMVFGTLQAAKKSAYRPESI